MTIIKFWVPGELSFLGLTWLTWGIGVWPVQEMDFLPQSSEVMAPADSFVTREVLTDLCHLNVPRLSGGKQTGGMDVGKAPLVVGLMLAPQIPDTIVL